MPKIYDNIKNQLLPSLSDSLKLAKRTDMCVGYFNLRGWRNISDIIEEMPGEEVYEEEGAVNRVCRLLIGMQKIPFDIIRSQYFKDDTIIDLKEVNYLKKRLAQEFKDQLTIGVPTNEDEIGLRKLSKQLKDKKVVVKLHLLHPLHAKLYIAHNNDTRIPIVAFMGSSNLTLAGLAKQGELNIDVLDQDAAGKLSDWFIDRWEAKWCIDITKELIEIIDSSWAAEKLIPPYHIYLKIAYHLSQEARAGINDFRLPKVFQDELLDFQQKAVQIAARHLHKRGGVVIGDVVGLGKTITATALAKLFEDDFGLETLIICPKNLVDMWEDYKDKYNLRCKIMSINVVRRRLKNLKRYRIVIIDESHNLRNDQGSRYKAIKQYLNENNSKVILLTATPYNKSYLDLSNQLRLFISDDQDLGITPENYINSLGGFAQFNSFHTETFIRSIKAFEKSDSYDDWQNLMHLYLVRRTRSFVKNNYCDTDESNGRKYLTFADGTRSYFPDRIPKKVEFAFNKQDTEDQYATLYSQQVVDILNALNLPRYGLGNYISESAKNSADEQEKIIIENLSRAGRRLMGFCRTNLFKRLESSGYSFLQSISRHILRNYLFIYAYENKLKLPIGKQLFDNLDRFIEDQDLDDSSSSDSNDNKTEKPNTNEASQKDKKYKNGVEFNLLLKTEDYTKEAEKLYGEFVKHKKYFRWIRSEHFASFVTQKEIKKGVEEDVTISLIDELEEDAAELLKILELGKDWKSEQDRKLKALEDLITKKYPKDKVLIFTQFADTAKYIYNAIDKSGEGFAQKHGKLEFVIGGEKSPTDKAYRFSPISNNKPISNNANDEIRVLIATDVLSEGQNLQDSHIIVNYDLPWAIIKLIQRAGRVDRIGQKAEQILCYSFLPEKGIEDIITLRGRLTDRIQQNANVVGSDEVFFDEDTVNLADLYNEKSGALDGDDEKDDEVDLTSYAYQIWKNAIDRDPSLIKTIPDLPKVLYSNKQNTDVPEREGVIVYTRTPHDNDILTWMNEKGEMITQSQMLILKAAECEPSTKALEKQTNHHDLVKLSLDYVKNDEINYGGSLGRKNSTKYQVYSRLKDYCERNSGSMFITEQLKKAIDDILNYPLKENAKDAISRQLKAGIDDEHLIDLVASLREQDKLSIIDLNTENKKDLQIICSLGLLNAK